MGTAPCDREVRPWKDVFVLLSRQALIRRLAAQKALFREDSWTGFPKLIVTRLAIGGESGEKTII
jgi:hypothetical protein